MRYRVFIFFSLLCGLVFCWGQVQSTPIHAVQGEGYPLLEDSSPYEIIPGIRVGSITAQTTFVDLQQQFGKSNVTAGEFYVAEGVCEAGAHLYPEDPARTLEIAWGNFQEQSYPTTVQMMGETSQWFIPTGLKFPPIRLGTHARLLETINGKPFSLSGFGWDYGGSITSWNGGWLDAYSP